MIRSSIFKFFFYLGIIFISLIFLPALLMPPKVVLFGGKLMGYWSKVCLNIFLSTKIIIKGKENINILFVSFFDDGDGKFGSIIGAPPLLSLLFLI